MRKRVFTVVLAVVFSLGLMSPAFADGHRHECVEAYSAGDVGDFEECIRELVDDRKSR